jgi:hypothetical protein
VDASKLYYVTVLAWNCAGVSVPLRGTIAVPTQIGMNFTNINKYLRSLAAPASGTTTFETLPGFACDSDVFVKGNILFDAIEARLIVKSKT